MRLQKYLDLMKKEGGKTPEGKPITITSLAEWIGMTDNGLRYMLAGGGTSAFFAFRLIRVSNGLIRLEDLIGDGRDSDAWESGVIAPEKPSEPV